MSAVASAHSAGNTLQPCKRIVCERIARYSRQIDQHPTCASWSVHPDSSRVAGDTASSAWRTTDMLLGRPSALRLAPVHRERLVTSECVVTWRGGHLSSLGRGLLSVWCAECAFGGVESCCLVVESGSGSGSGRLLGTCTTLPPLHVPPPLSRPPLLHFHRSASLPHITRLLDATSIRGENWCRLLCAAVRV